jgi:hypothetical protein
MPSTRRTGLSLALVLALAASAFAADVTGKWKAEYTGPDGQARTNVFTFAVSGEKLTGTVTSSMAPEPAAIEDGTIKGDEIAFGVTRNFGGNEIKLRYKGKVSGDEIPLTVTGSAGGQDFEFQITAKREK